MFTEEDYEKELKRVQRSRRQEKPAVIFFIILMVIEFVVGGVMMPNNYTYGILGITLGISTAVLFVILLIFCYLERKQLARMQDKDRFIFDENEKRKKQLEERYNEYIKNKKHVSFDLDDLIMYDMVDEDFDDKE